MTSSRSGVATILAACAASVTGLACAAGCSSSPATIVPAAATQTPAARAPAAQTPAARESAGAPGATTVPAAAGIGTGPGCHGAGRPVWSASELRSALAHAGPGDTILLEPGLYQGDFGASRSGSAHAPITLCGSRGAVLDGTTITTGYTFYLDHASWWRVEGFTVEGGQKGVVTDGASHDLLYGLYVHSTGDEAIHLREFSSHNTVSHCVIRDTGLLVPFYGEGIYVGSAHKNWCRYTGCQPDASNDNLIEDNSIADTTAENIDIKEGTTGGQIIGNRFDGTGMVASAATAWVNVKGNDWTIEDNTGANSIKDGFQVHQVYPGWGIGNVFIGNHADVNGPGYGIFVQNKRLETVVGCDNEVANAGRGFSTISCSAV
jgi:hypothetical protein